MRGIPARKNRRDTGRFMELRLGIAKIFATEERWDIGVLFGPDRFKKTGEDIYWRRKLVWRWTFRFWREVQANAPD